METKDCSKCGTTHPSEHYLKHSRICKACKNKEQRERRKAQGDAATKKYEKTKKGYLMRAYRNMQSRVTGVQSAKAHLYEGKEILPRDEFYAWALGDETFNLLFAEYQELEYDIRFAPSIDRIDSRIGYTLSNIRWLPHWKNSQLGAISQHENKEKQCN